MPVASTEGRHPAALGIAELHPQEAAVRLAEAQIAAAAAVRPALPAIAAAAAAAARTLAAGGRLIYAGAGSSGVMALSDALELAGTFGLAPDRAPTLLAGGADTLLHMRGAVEDDPATARAEAASLRLGSSDLLLAVSASGATPYTLAAAEAARAAGAPLAAIANVAASPLLALARWPVLLDTGPEMVAGSTRMGAATAQKIALNILSTLAAIELGHVHDGMMVNLTADNAKLRDRAARIVAETAGVDAATARAALEAAGGAAKPACLIAAGAPDLPAAEARLAAASGRLGPALAALRTEAGE